MLPLISARLRMLGHSASAVQRGGMLKFTVVSVFGVGLILLLFSAMIEGFRFLRAYPDFQAVLMGYMFSVYFVTMLLMLTFSNAVISFGALFRARETHMLMSLPVGHSSLYAYKVGESLLFSSWAFLVLAGPLMAAYGLYGAGERLPAVFYLAVAALMLPFVFIPASAGALIAMLLTRFFPRQRGRVLGLAFAAAVVAGLVLGLRAGFFRWQAGIDDYFVERVLSSFAFSQSPYLPSAWLSEGVAAAARSDWRTVAFDAGLLASTALVLWMAGDFVAEKLYAASFSRAHGTSTRRRYRAGGLLDWAAGRAAVLAPFEARLMAKDVRTFLRDPVQWSQVLIFFGLLFLYVANFRNLGYQRAILEQIGGHERWANFVAFANLTAAGLTLATMTTRFVFPLISIEGRRFWLLGLLPVKRSRILWGKYFFALGGSVLLLLPLAGLSSIMLGSTPRLAGLHILTAAAMCVGLPGIAVGFGALFPNFREDNPSKIVSGFGGTVCLVVSLAFVGLLVAGMGVLGQRVALAEVGVLAPIRWLLLLGAVGGTAVAAAAAILPMWLGSRAINQAEL